MPMLTLSYPTRRKIEKLAMEMAMKKFTNCMKQYLTSWVSVAKRPFLAPARADHLLSRGSLQATALRQTSAGRRRLARRGCRRCIRLRRRLPWSRYLRCRRRQGRISVLRRRRSRPASPSSVRPSDSHHRLGIRADRPARGIGTPLPRLSAIKCPSRTPRRSSKLFWPGLCWTCQPTPNFVTSGAGWSALALAI